MRRHQQKQQLGNTLCFFSKVQRLLSCQIILGILIFHITNQSLSKAVALTSSGYVEICSLSETEIELQYDAQKGEFVQLELDEDSSTTTTTTTTTTDKDVEQAEEGMHGSSSKPNKKGGKTRTLQLRKESHSSHSSSSSSSSSSKLKQRRHIMSQKQPEQSNYNDNNNIMIARECKCVSHYRREKSYCLIHSNENYCQIPTSSNDPIECFHSSMYLVFVRNLWPLSLLWLLALTFYLISTEAGRSTYKYFFSQVCCCFTDMCNNSRLINNIISRETSLRELYQVASLTREEQELQSAAVRNNSTVITYILKTKEFFSGKTTTITTTSTSSGAKESTSCSSGSTVELTKQCQRSGNKCSADNDIFESPSNETLLTSPDSFGSSPSSDNDISPMTATPTATGAISTSPTNEEDEHYDGRVHEQNTNVSLSDIHNDINKSSDNIQDNIVDDDEEEEENLCTICMVDIEDGNRVGVLSCGHLFHADCLKEWIKRRNACPLCQTQVAEERADPNNNERNEENARVRYPTTFTVRTTGSPAEPMIRRSRGRRRGAGTRTSDLRDEDTTRRQLFVVNGNSRIPPSLSSSAGVTLISTRMVSPSNQRNGGNQQRRVLVGDASRTSTGRSHRNDNGVMLERRPMRMTSLLQARNNQS